MKLKPKDLLKDDCEIIYEVIEVFSNSAIVVPFPNKGDFACEIMTFQSMENEKWKIIGTLE